MSQQELEQTDQEVMEMVNKAASPEATQIAEKIAEEHFAEAKNGEFFEDVEEKTVPDAMDAQWIPANRSLIDKIARDAKKRFRNRMIICVVLCILIAAALVAAWAVPKLVIWVVNIGVLSCGITAGIAIDRFVRRWRV